MKLPEPEIRLAWCSGSEQWELRELKHCLARKEYDRIIGYTEAQLKQAVRDAYEEAAKVCEDLYKHLNYDTDCQKHWTNQERVNKIYAVVIRALIKEVA